MSQAQSARGEGTGTVPAGEFGVWIFLASETLLFGAVILAYAVARLGHGEAFAAASAMLSLPLGTINTAVLLTSSLAAAVAVIMAERDEARLARLAILATALLGVVFLGIKALEYDNEAKEGLLPILGLTFSFPGADPQHARLFFDLYLALTGLHALHLLTGIGLMMVLAAGWKRFQRPARTLRLSALYWHLIDVVWVFLFPILYLVR